MHARSILILSLIATIVTVGLFARRSPGQMRGESSLASIQQTLDATGFCQLGAGTYKIDAPIRLKAGQRLAGVGFATKLVYEGATPYAILFGEKGKSNYGCYLDDLCVSGGGVLCEVVGQHCGIERVWVTGARSDGFRIDAIGERLVLRDAVAWENAGNGFVVSCGTTNNGILFDHCNAQENGGHGVLLETTAANGELIGCVLRDCTIQGNGRAGRVAAEVLLRGYVLATRIENTWIEQAPKPPRSVQVGLRSENALFRDERGEVLIRRPGRLLIDGASVISQFPRAIEFADCNDCVIDQLSVAPATARIHWRSAPGGENLPGSTRPRGKLWLLDPAQIVADAELK